MNKFTKTFSLLKNSHFAHIKQQPPLYFLLRYKLYISQEILFTIKKTKNYFYAKLITTILITFLIPLPGHTQDLPKPPIDKFLTNIQSHKKPSGLNHVNCIYVINLDKRPERWERTRIFFEEQNLYANRVSAVNGWVIPTWTKLQLSGPTHLFLSGGEIGCFLSHLSIYQDALNEHFNAVWICEDDITFTDNPNLLDAYIEELSIIDPDWDMLYTDNSTHGMGDQKPRKGQNNYTPLYYSISENLLRVHGRHGLHSVIFSSKGLEKITNYFKSVYLFSPLDVDIHYVPTLKEYSVKKNVATALNTSSDTSIGSSLNQGL